MKWKVGIITSFDRGVAAHHVQKLHAFLPENFEISCVIQATNPPSRKRSFWRRKILKFLKIGIIGTLNGIRMRPWFNARVEDRLNIPELQTICSQVECECIQVAQLNSDETRIVLTDYDLDIAISLGNGFIAPSVFSIPRLGMLNIHHEILPEYQNAQSVIWQLYHRSDHTGYSIHQITRNIDQGVILKQESIPISVQNSLSETITFTIADVWEQSAQGLYHLLEHGQNLEHLVQDEKRNAGHFTTPSGLQFFKIWWRWRSLKHSKSK
ncbi:formyltransferase family protein [Flavobacteriales bacterium]|nr:formyltransferase family protein [Flavobacteriales bacterium]